MLYEVITALIDVSEFHRIADPDRSRIRVFLAADHFEQGRFAGAVGADDADDAPRRQAEIQVFDQQSVAVSLAHTRGLNDHIAEARSGGNVEFQIFFPFFRFLSYNFV